MLTKTKREVIDDFRDNFDKLAFAQPLVAKVIGANMGDLNTWRSRGFVNIGVGDGSRIFYSGRGLIHAGIVNELAHFFEPKRAAHFSEELMNTVSFFGDGMMFSNIVEFHRRYEGDGSPSSVTRELFMTMAPDAMTVSISGERAQLFFPLKDLMERWAINAQRHLGGGYAA